MIDLNPSSALTRSRNCGPFSASRIAALATATMRVAPRAWRSRDSPRKACMVRAIVASPERSIRIDIRDKAQRRAGTGGDAKMIRRIPGEDHDAPGIRADVDDGDTSARRCSRGFGMDGHHLADRRSVGWMNFVTASTKT